ncbi:MAG: hypothetical protein Q4E56_00690 [Pseudomonadota bacterium]|nr:hypothetical protein [Pseudomonadota bacterium]
MIDTDDILEHIGAAAGIWCAADTDTPDLAAAADLVVARGLRDISVAPAAVPIVWPWLEHTNVQIAARFYLSPASRVATFDDVSDIAARINSAFKQGASAAQVFMRLADVVSFVQNMSPIRSDLFFNKDLVIGLNIGEINPSDWAELIENLNQIGASLLLVLPQDRGLKSDFVGRVYGLLDGPVERFNGALHWCLGAGQARAEQVVRLATAMQPQIISRLKFWVM